MKRYVLIGGSTACAGAIEGILSRDKSAEITVICGEGVSLYSRPLISYFLEGKTTEEKIFHKKYDNYCKNGVNIIKCKASKILTDNKQVVLEDGKVVGYDKLLVATGSYPFVPPMKGLETVERTQSFYTFDDALKLKGTLRPDEKVLIIGAGLIGLKCAEGIYPTTKNITVADMQDRVLPNAVTPRVSEIMQKHMEGKGIRFCLGAAAESFDGNKAKLTNGETVEFDVLITALGVRPETSLVADAGGEVNRGIVVDEYMRTSLPDVYAAGDCASGLEAITGQKRLLQLFPSAYTGGRIAGVNMTGGEERFTTDVPLNSTKLFGKRFISCGVFDGELTEIEDDGYKAFYIKDGRLNGYILVDNVQRAGIYSALIAKRADLSGVDLPLMMRAPQLMAFDAKTRRAMLNENFMEG